MGRIRSIKPEFPQSESMGRISRDARLTFILLWTIVDDSGRTRDSSRFLASMLYPYDDDAPKLIGGWLEELEREGCITRYSVVHQQENDGVVKSSQKKLDEPHVNSSFANGPGSTKVGCIVDHYLEINKWLNHQKIDRPTPSKIPPIDIGSTNTRRIVPEASSADQDMDMDQDRDRDKDRDQEKANHHQKAVVVVVGANGAPHDPPPPVGKKARSGKGKTEPPCPHQAIIDLYHEILPTCFRVEDWTPKRAGVLAARWREDSDRQELSWWRDYFKFVSASKFLTGRVSPTNGRKPFRASLPWLTNRENLVKVAEDQYA